MDDTTAKRDSREHTGPQYPPGYRMRRGRNWFFLGLNYAGYYLNRYNLAFASKHLCDTFGFSNKEFGTINTARHWAYALGQFWNGLFADRIGGKRAMAIGGFGTALMNLLFGLGAYHRFIGPFMGTLAWFVGIRLIDGYLQSFGAPGMVKINAAWFAHHERGRFAGIFGIMISIGRFGINWLAPFVLTGFAFWRFHAEPGRWDLVFFIPAGAVVILTTLMLLMAKKTPEAAGYPGAVPLEAIDGEGDEPLPMWTVLTTILRKKMVWMCAGAYFCTGFVRYGVDDWFPKYFQEVQGVTLDAKVFTTVALMIPFVAMSGSLISGYVSDLAFRGRRAPVAAILYFTETAIILIGAQLASAWAVAAALILVAFTCNSTHSILGAAAPMDAGGRKMAGFATGFIDSFQYIAAGLSGRQLGALIDKYGWDSWLYAMAGFGVLGGILMVIMMLSGVEERPAPDPE